MVSGAGWRHTVRALHGEPGAALVRRLPLHGGSIPTWAARVEAALTELGSNAGRRATGFTVLILCFLIAARITDVLSNGQPGEVPFTLGLFVLPVVCAFPSGRRAVRASSVEAIAAQGVLTWLPFVVFGSHWEVGIDGLLAGLVLLTLRGPLAWAIAAGLLAAEGFVRVTLVGLPFAPPWLGAVLVVTFYVDDALIFFGLVRLSQIVADVEEARFKRRASP